MDIITIFSSKIGKHISEIPLNVTTTLSDFNLCFIEYEDAEKLLLAVTGEDGRERLNIVFKKHIVSIAVVYDGDVQIVSTEDDKIIDMYG